MIASLPMYWRAENAPLWRAFWKVLQATVSDEGVALPDLTAPDDIPEPWSDHWLRSDLALSMTCGLPFRSVLRDKVAYVGTLTFGLNAKAGHYFSQIVVRSRDEARAKLGAGDAVLAFNAPDSQSGWAATQTATAAGPELKFAGVLQTGSHAASVHAVAHGKADIAFVDAITWRILETTDPMARGLELLGASVSTPGLPLISHKGADVAALQRAIAAAVSRFRTETPDLMGGPLGFEVLDVEEYLSLPIPKAPAAALTLGQ